MVLKSKESRIASIGVVEGDAGKHIKRYTHWDEVKERIYITQDKEVESYFFRKRQKINTAGKKQQTPTQYGKFKKYLEKNRDACREFSKLISRQKCNEIDEFLAFLEN